MAAPPPTYDLVLLLDSTAPDDQRRKILSDVEAMITRAGEIVSKHDWGVRPTAYEIRHKADAEYHLLQFHGPASLLEDLQRTLRITDGVTRFRVIKLAPGTPPPPDGRPGAGARRGARRRASHAAVYRRPFARSTTSASTVIAPRQSPSAAGDQAGQLNVQPPSSRCAAARRSRWASTVASSNSGRSSESGSGRGVEDAVHLPRRVGRPA